MRFGRVTRGQEVLSAPLLRRLQVQIRYLARLQETLARCLPALAAHCRITGYREGTLTLCTDNHALAGQIRYLQASHVRQLQQTEDFAGLLRLRVVIADAPEKPRQRLPPLPPLAPAVGELLLQTASQLDDGEISEALRRLASHASDKRTA